MLPLLGMIVGTFVCLFITVLMIKQIYLLIIEDKEIYINHDLAVGEFQYLQQRFEHRVQRFGEDNDKLSIEINGGTTGVDGLYISIYKCDGDYSITLQLNGATSKVSNENYRAWRYKQLPEHVQLIVRPLIDCCNQLHNQKVKQIAIDYANRNKYPDSPLKDITSTIHLTSSNDFLRNVSQQAAKAKKGS
jgi:uncharacterized membrane protein